MSKHTPGPWRAHESDLHADFHCIEQTDTNGERVTDIAYLTLHKGEEGRANARLIAAAPDLLAALEAAIECGMVPISSAREGGASAFARQAVVADMIRDAVAKATGEHA